MNKIPPPPYYNALLARDASCVETAIMQELQVVLLDKKLVDFMSSGYGTLAMIRPNLRGALIGHEGSDAEAAEKIERQISNLGIAVKFTLTLDREAMDAFYDGPPKYESMLPKPADRNPAFPNRWEEFVDFMTSAPTTVLLMESNSIEPNATQIWRSQLGHWNVEKNRDPATIRGSLAVDNFNNLLHGSDSPEAAVRELGIIAELVGRIATEL